MCLPYRKVVENNVEIVACKSIVFGAQSRLLEIGANSDFVS